MSRVLQCCLANRPLVSQQIQRNITVGGQSAKPACELMYHQPGGNAGRIDRASRCATSLLCFGLGKERGSVLFPFGDVTDRKYANDFAKHSAVDPKLASRVDRPPNRPTSADRVDTTEYGIANSLLRSKAILTILLSLPFWETAGMRVFALGSIARIAFSGLPGSSAQ